MTTVDLAPSTTTTRAAVVGVTDAQLGDPTPCARYTVGDVAEHVGMLAQAFAHAARKEPMPGEQRPGDASLLEDGWRDRVAADLDALAVAWTDPAATTGMTMAGPVELPGEVAALVALNEVVVHGWDLAVSTGQPYDPDPAAVAACTGFVESFEAPAGGPADDGGLFGPPVAVADDATPLDRLLALTGRDPSWRPPA